MKIKHLRAIAEGLLYGILYLLLLATIALGFAQYAYGQPLVPTFNPASPNVKTLGAQCDGSSHPLSQFFGSNLAAAQAAYPVLNDSTGLSEISLTTEADTAAILLAGNIARNSAWPTVTPFQNGAQQNYGRFVITGLCTINQTLDLTAIRGSAVFDFSGAVLHLLTNGNPGIDMTFSQSMTVRGLHIVGDCNTATPNIGLYQGRLSTTDNSDYNLIDKPQSEGCFTLAPYYNAAAEETTMIDGVWFNNSNNAYGMILDGINHFDICSQFNATCLPQNTGISFDAFTCIKCAVQTSGTGVINYWISDTKHVLIKESYSIMKGTNTGPAVVVDSSFNGNIIGMNLDIHMEGSFGSEVQFTSNVASVTIQDFQFFDGTPQQTGSLFSLGSGVTGVTIQNAHLRTGTLTSPQTWWDTAADYTINGIVQATSGTGWTTPGTYTGLFCTPSCVTH
jgi:hypothetical protein